MTNSSEEQFTAPKPDILLASAPIVCLVALCLLTFISFFTIQESDQFFEIYKILDTVSLKVVLLISAVLAGLVSLFSIKAISVKDRIKSLGIALPFVIILLMAFALKMSWLIILLLCLVLIYPIAKYRS